MTKSEIKGITKHENGANFLNIKPEEIQYVYLYERAISIGLKSAFIITLVLYDDEIKAFDGTNGAHIEVGNFAFLEENAELPKDVRKEQIEKRLQELSAKSIAELTSADLQEYNELTDELQYF